MVRFYYVFWLHLLLFDELATTVIFPYLLTLSLHDALPICASRRCQKVRPTTLRQASTTMIQVDRASSSTAPSVTCSRNSDMKGLTAPPLSQSCTLSAATSKISTSSSRSEEPTSELQSLMRNTYAVFCLHTKNYIPIPTNLLNHT